MGILAASGIMGLPSVAPFLLEKAMNYLQSFGCGLALLLALLPAFAETPVSGNGTLVVVPATGIVTRANDEARAIFMVEEQDKDKAVAASRVNQKMKRGTEILKKADPQAQFKTYGYYTFPVYADEQPRAGNRAQQLVGWRVGQYLEMKTTNLERLPKAVATAQNLIALNGLQFELSDQASRALDQLRIEAAYTNLTERIAAIAKAMGKKPSDAVLEIVDFEGSGAYVDQDGVEQKTAMHTAAAQEVGSVTEPNFEPGETTLEMRVVGKFRIR